jgi:DNA-binding transcriptional LysR family regulator
MSDRVLALAIFVRVAETGSFSRAGREIGMAQPGVSRIVATLEARLGVKLFLRTTRKVTLTEAGAALLRRARDALAEIEDAENAARGADRLVGLLRVATPVTFGAREIATRLAPFLETHPSLDIELLMADRNVDLVEEGVDVAIRLGPLADSSFTARRLESAPRYLLASPAYLDRRGTPAAPADLARHHIIGGRPPAADIWTLRDAHGCESAVGVRARLIATSVEGVVAAAVAGLGIAQLSHFACREDYRRGRLVRLLGAWSLPPIEVHALLPGGRRPSAKARAFVDYLAKALAVAPEPVE